MQLFRPKYRVDECLVELKKVLDSGWTGTGPQCNFFEQEWNEYIGSSYSIFLSSCTAALHIAVRLLGLSKNELVLTTPLTFVSTNAVILYESLMPLFVDIHKKTLSIDPELAKKKIEETGAKAIIWVHYGGNVHCDFLDFVDWCKAKGVQIIEDCAHAAGARYSDGTKVGSLKDTISCFSYQAVKNLPTSDSGMICLPNEEMYKRAKKLSWLGIDKDTYSRTNAQKNEIYKWKYDVPELGWKYNGNDIVAAIARVQLKYLEYDNAYRAKIDGWYRQYFDALDLNEDFVKLLFHHSGSSNHLVVAMVKNRDEVISALKANAIAPGVHYLPNYNFAPFRKYNLYNYEATEEISREIISLPNHLELKEENIKFICEVVVDASRN